MTVTRLTTLLSQYVWSVFWGELCETRLVRALGVFNVRYKTNTSMNCIVKLWRKDFDFFQPLCLDGRKIYPNKTDAFRIHDSYMFSITSYLSRNKYRH